MLNMELALSLGLGFLEKSPQLSRSKVLGFCTGLGVGDATKYGDEKRRHRLKPILMNFTVGIELMSIAVHRVRNLTDGDGRGLDVNRMPLAVAEESEEGAAVSSPNSTVSSFQMDFGIRNGSNTNRGKRDLKKL
ncbi:hypothetical protein F3Y22_tig00110303pilonHSYRG00297 [Hibiscus syriacus]|uniref:HD-ZIP protein N-terminal domain-containing protein n=1 Tax=Hibiscus syriacus TaxID=106335 RepID=A0A6A3B784_HIBSY|nr:hypothetical protein F3Y22_tig00110303pilonHSYRG00297 [Hibiscus syriacus]